MIRGLPIGKIGAFRNSRIPGLGPDDASPRTSSMLDRGRDCVPKDPARCKYSGGKNRGGAEHMAHRDHGGSHGEEATAIDRSTFVCNYDESGRGAAFTLRFSRFRILCSITMIAWRRGSTVSVEACFSSLGLAEGILHGQQTRTGNWKW